MRSTTLTAAVLTALYTPLLLADEATTSLPAVTVSGDWLAGANNKTAKKHPGARNIVERKDMQAAGANTISEAVRLIPGVNATDNSFSGGGQTSMNIGVRGLAGRLSPRSTILLDGIPMSYAPYGQPQLSIAPVLQGNLERIDAIRGGGSVRYGPQNVGGIINFVTREIPEVGSTGELSIRQNFHSNAANETGQTSTSLFAGKQFDNGLGVAVIAGKVDGSTHRQNSKEDIGDYNLKFRYAPNDDLEVSGKVQHYQANAKLPGGLTVTEYNNNRFQSVRRHDIFEGERDAAQLKVRKWFANGSELEISGYTIDTFRSTDLANNNNTLATQVNSQPRNYQTKALETRYSLPLKTGTTDHLVSVGIRQMDETGDERNYLKTFPVGGTPSGQGTLNRHGTNTTEATAVYVDDRIKAGKLTVTPGVRFEDIKTTGKNELTKANGSKQYKETLPSLHVSYAINPNLEVYGGYGESFGALQFFQLNMAGDTKLEAEKAKTLESGVRHTTPATEMNATVYQTKFNNQIELVNPTTYANRGKTKHQGLELAGKLKLDEIIKEPKLAGVTLNANYTLSNATLESGVNTGKDLAFHSRHTGSIGVGLERAGWQHNATVYNQTSQFADDANTAAEAANGRNGKVPGFTTLNLSTSKDFKLAGSKLKVGAGINNALDKEYYLRTGDSNGGKLAATPRTLYLQTSLEW